MPAFVDSLVQFFLAINIAYVFGVFIFGLYAWFTFATVYHFIRFGIGTAPKNYAFTFLVGSLVLFIFAVVLYHNIEWESLASLIAIENNVNFYSQ